MTKRRTTYKIERVADLGDGLVSLPILETNDKREFFECQDEIMTERGVESLVKANARTAVFAY